jgi:hypothetical protein
MNKIRSTFTIAAAAAVLLHFGQGTSHAHQTQYVTGDACFPENNGVTFDFDEGAIKNTGSVPKAFLCPIAHLGTKAGSFRSWSHFQFSDMEVDISVTLATAGSANCTPVVIDVLTGNSAWGSSQSFTGSGHKTFVWAPGQLPDAFANVTQLTFICGIPPNGRINGLMTYIN